MITVLRLGHRKERDKRVTTHCALVARAFGAKKIVLSGEEDAAIIEGVNAVTANWGGPFRISYVKDWRREISRFKGARVHLTMYGEPLQKKIGALRRKKKVLVVVGAGKVPGEVFSLCDFNVSVTSQPHSEVAALAVFLHEYSRGSELNKKFGGWRKKIEPSAKGKKVREKKLLHRLYNARRRNV